MTVAEPLNDVDPFVEELRKRGMISPFVPGTVVTGPSLVVDKHGCAWWVRPEAMVMIRATANHIKVDTRDG